MTIRLSLWALTLFALSLGGCGCDFPHVPGGASPGIRAGQRFEAFSTPATPTSHKNRVQAREEFRASAEGPPRQIQGLMISNSVSSLVIENEDGGLLTVQVTPQTRLLIGGERAGLREIQPGTAVRASYAPVGQRLDVALQVEADPTSAGWQPGRDMPKE